VDCPQEEDLVDYMYGHIHEDIRRIMGAHIRNCKPCGNKIFELQKTKVPIDGLFLSNIERGSCITDKQLEDIMCGTLAFLEREALIAHTHICKDCRQSLCTLNATFDKYVLALEKSQKDGSV